MTVLQIRMHVSLCGARKSIRHLLQHQHHHYHRTHHQMIPILSLWSSSLHRVSERMDTSPGWFCCCCSSFSCLSLGSANAVSMSRTRFDPIIMIMISPVRGKKNSSSRKKRTPVPYEHSLVKQEQQPVVRQRLILWCCLCQKGKRKRSMATAATEKEGSNRKHSEFLSFFF